MLEPGCWLEWVIGTISLQSCPIYTGFQMVSGPNSGCWYWTLKPYKVWNQHTSRTTCSHMYLPGSYGHPQALVQVSLLFEVRWPATQETVFLVVAPKLWISFPRDICLSFSIIASASVWRYFRLVWCSLNYHSFLLCVLFCCPFADLYPHQAETKCMLNFHMYDFKNAVYLVLCS